MISNVDDARNNLTATSDPLRELNFDISEEADRYVFNKGVSSGTQTTVLLSEYLEKCLLRSLRVVWPPSIQQIDWNQ